jgi:hypothetical protein
VDGLVPTLASGTYTPTLTNVANLDSSSPLQCQYLRIGNVVHVAGELQVNPTTALVLTRLGISLPVASNLTANRLAGVAANYTGTSVSTASPLYADATNDRAEMGWFPEVNTNHNVLFSFTYVIQ